MDDDATELETAWYLRRLDGGLFTLQTVDYILAWIIMEDDGVCVLHRLGSSKSNIPSFRFKHMPYKCLTERINLSMI